MKSQPVNSESSTLANTLRQACKKIAPVWSLENFVAVNPYLGLSDQKFDSAALQLATLGDVQMTMPFSFYLDKINEETITRADLQEAISRKSSKNREIDSLLQSVQNADSAEPVSAGLATLIDAAAQVSEQDWNRYMINRITSWAASYFDLGQSTWNPSDQQSGIFQAWKVEAEIDLSPEIAGLNDFRNIIKSLPNDSLQATQKALEILDIPEETLPIYLHRLLMRVGGWSAYAARIDWDNEVYGGQDGALIEFLSILICWEAAMLKSLDGPEIRVLWSIAKDKLQEAQSQSELSPELETKLILQEAFDIAKQRELISKINDNQQAGLQAVEKPNAQAVFCIDVRSEVFRRNLEQTDAKIETLGFAGFFGFPINFIPLGHEEGIAQGPVLIPTGPTIKEELPDSDKNQLAYDKRILENQAKNVWKTFKSGAISCFSFVSPIGLSYLPKLFTDSFGVTRPVPHPDQDGLSKADNKQKSIRLTQDKNTGIALTDRVKMAKNALKAMSLNEDLASLVMIVGHGASTVNNPHAHGLDCGACGGHSGEANAKVAAAVLNDQEVRNALLEEGMKLPNDTVFLACLHDTTTDHVTIYNEHEVPAEQAKQLSELKEALAKAGKSARAERALRMNTTGDMDKDLIGRSKDWSQIRPEWGLAGCSAFVVANRSRTKNIDLEGKSFLHSYDWKKDQGFGILEVIMTAPMVVTSWINLQYYASTVDNKNYGSGNKTLHNITAGLGVLEGYAGDLRVGLPLQSVHDGENFQHEPIRLNVIIEAPIEAMNTVLQKHPKVKDLCDNEWIHLLAMDENGKVSQRYVGGLNWEAI